MSSTREVAENLIRNAFGTPEDNPIHAVAGRTIAALTDAIDDTLHQREIKVRAEAWQWIESAPKDGSEIVVYGPIFYGWNKDRTPDISERQYSCVSRYYAEGEKPMTAEGWYFGAPGIQTSIYPTHWMPLPALRRDSEAQEQSK